MTRISIAVLTVVVLLFAGNASAQVQVSFPEESFTYDAQQPALGAWIGNITREGNETPFFAAMVVDRDDAGALTVKLTLFTIGALDKACDSIRIVASSLAFSVAGPGGEFRFKGEVDESGQRIRGTVTKFVEGEPTGNGGIIELARIPRPEDLPDPLAFAGTLSIQTIELGMTIVLGKTPGGNWVGHIDVPMQSLQGLPLVNITEKEGVISAVLPVPGGASMDVTLDDARQLLTGKFKQGGMVMAIEFDRDMNYAYREKLRPQNPVKPYPYETREIAVGHPDGFVLAGALTIPQSAEFGSGPFPCAILISGSGQQDRDESLLGHKPFLVLADHLTRQGIAVMRYDDRGVGGSGGIESLAKTTTWDYATDTLAVMNYMKTIEVIDAKRIGLIGHSEGGMIAPLVGTMTDDVAFMVLMAGPGVSGRELIMLQRTLLGKASGTTDEEMTRANVQFEEIERLISNGGSEVEVVNLFVKFARDANPSGGPDDENLARAVKSQAVTLMSPWFRYFMDFEPADYLGKATCPVLAINGTLDLQVWHEQNLDAIVRIMAESGGDLTAKRYEGLNHLFQPAETGLIAEYAQIEITMDETVLGDIAAWINAKVN